MSPVTAYDLPLPDRIGWLWKQIHEDVSRAAAALALGRSCSPEIDPLLPKTETLDMELGFAVKNLMEIIKLTAGMKGPRD